MQTVKYIVIHAADTPADMDIGAVEIRDWHVNENGWRDIGYHYVIRRDGTLERGRDESVPGAHAVGHNTHSIGICMVGGKPDCNYTAAQWSCLEPLVRDLLGRYPKAKVIGHRDVSEKPCPMFDAKAWAGSL